MSLDVREEVWELACTMKDSGRMVGERGVFFSGFPRKLPSAVNLGSKEEKNVIQKRRTQYF